MKKILFALALILSVSFAQAAAIDWTIPARRPVPTVDYVSGKPSPYVGNAIAYLVHGSTNADIVKSIKDGTFLGSSVGNIVVDANTKLANGILPGGNLVSDVGDISRGNFNLIVFDANAIDDATKFLVSGDVAGITYDGLPTTQHVPVDFGKAIYAGGLWQKMPGGSVPEPTVLALLALGVAGLALRRRA